VHLLNYSIILEEEKVLPDWSLLWRPKSFNDTDHWFLLTEEGTDALSMCDEPLLEAQPPGGGIIVFKADSMIVTLEAGFGVKTLPLILLESSLHSQVTDWTRHLQIRGSMSLQMSYFNSRLALWEPLIEPTPDKNG
jgi:vacuolar protein sorting-associated protein 13A/C